MVASDIDAIAAPVAPWLSAVDRRLDEMADNEPSPMIGAILQTLFDAPAKRFRPLLVLLTAGAFDCLGDQAVELACGVECLHTATLVHDDVIDGSAKRRGRETIHTVWSKGVAILAGDFMFALAADQVAGLGRPTIVSKFADAIMQMSRAELHWPDLRDGPQAARADYLAKIEGKTASLIGLCASSAADLAGRSVAEQEQLRLAGVELGQAFQICDDVLDLRGNPDRTGKPGGGDLLQATLTLPILLHLAKRPSGLVARFYRDDETRAGDDQLAEALAELGDGDGPNAAIAEARTIAQSARARLELLPVNECRAAIVNLCDFVVERAR